MCGAAGLSPAVLSPSRCTGTSRPSAAKQPSRPDQEHLEVGKDRAHPSERFDVPSFNWKEDMWE